MGIKNFRVFTVSEQAGSPELAIPPAIQDIIDQYINEEEPVNPQQQDQVIRIAQAADRRERDALLRQDRERSGKIQHTPPTGKGRS